MLKVSILLAVLVCATIQGCYDYTDEDYDILFYPVKPNEVLVRDPEIPVFFVTSFEDAKAIANKLN